MHCIQCGDVMDHTCGVKLLMLVLLLHGDVQLNTFTGATPAWQCKSAYCRDKHAPSSQGNRNLRETSSISYISSMTNVVI